MEEQASRRWCARLSLVLVGVVASCNRIPSELEQCRRLVSERQNLEAERVFTSNSVNRLNGSGEILLELLRCDRSDYTVEGGIFDEIRRLCTRNAEALLNEVNIEDMYPSKLLERADEAACGELRYRGRRIYIHPDVARFRLKHPEMPL